MTQSDCAGYGRWRACSEVYRAPAGARASSIAPWSHSCPKATSGRKVHGSPSCTTSVMRRVGVRDMLRLGLRLGLRGLGLGLQSQLQLGLGLGLRLELRIEECGCGSLYWGTHDRFGAGRLGKRCGPHDVATALQVGSKSMYNVRVQSPCTM